MEEISLEKINSIYESIKNKIFILNIGDGFESLEECHKLLENLDNLEKVLMRAVTKYEESNPKLSQALDNVQTKCTSLWLVLNDFIEIFENRNLHNL